MGLLSSLGLGTGLVRHPSLAGAVLPVEPEVAPALPVPDGRATAAAADAAAPDAEAADRPALLQAMAEVLEAVSPWSGTGALPAEQPASPLIRALSADRRRQLEAMAAVRVAEQQAAVAAQRYQRLRAVAEANVPPPAPLPSWQRLALLILGVGVGLAVLCMLLVGMAWFLPGPLLVVPAALGLAAVMYVTVRTSARGRGPVVDDLVGAFRELGAAEAAVRRARELADEAAASWADRARRARSEVLAWCARQHVPARASVLRALAAQARRESGGRGRVRSLFLRR